MKFEEALVLLKDGKKIRRKEEWGKTTKIFIRDKQLLMNNGDTEFDYANQYSHWIIDDIFADDWEEYKEPLLSEEEKEYLKMLIKFHPNKIGSVVVCSRIDYKLVSLYYKIENEYVGCKGDHSLDYDCYTARKDDFNNLENDKKYTLKELGLDEA